jgi:hypothetical protein
MQLFVQWIPILSGVAAQMTLVLNVKVIIETSLVLPKGTQLAISSIHTAKEHLIHWLVELIVLKWLLDQVLKLLLSITYRIMPLCQTIRITYLVTIIWKLKPTFGRMERELSSRLQVHLMWAFTCTEVTVVKMHQYQ